MAILIALSRLDQVLVQSSQFSFLRNAQFANAIENQRNDPARQEPKQAKHDDGPMAIPTGLIAT